MLAVGGRDCVIEFHTVEAQCDTFITGEVVAGMSARIGDRVGAAYALHEVNRRIVFLGVMLFALLHGDFAEFMSHRRQKHPHGGCVPVYRHHFLGISHGRHLQLGPGSVDYYRCHAVVVGHGALPGAADVDGGVGEWLARHGVNHLHKHLLRCGKLHDSS